MDRTNRIWFSGILLEQRNNKGELKMWIIKPIIILVLTIFGFLFYASQPSMLSIIWMWLSCASTGYHIGGYWALKDGELGRGYY